MKTIFAIFGVSNPSVLGQRIVGRFPVDNLQVGHGQWLVATEGTAQTVSESLGLTGDVASTALVVAVSGYHGRMTPNVWEWIKAKWGGA